MRTFELRALTAAERAGAPCPFCTDDRAFLYRHARKYSVVCRSCAAEGPWAKSESGAIGNWRLRRRPTAVELTGVVRRALLALDGFWGAAGVFVCMHGHAYAAVRFEYDVIITSKFGWYRAQRTSAELYRCPTCHERPDQFLIGGILPDPTPPPWAAARALPAVTP